MLCARSLHHWLCLTILILATTAFAKDAAVRDECDWYCFVEKKLDQLQRNQDRLLRYLFPDEYPSSSSPSSNPSGTQVSSPAIYLAITFGTPSATYVPAVSQVIGQPSSSTTAPSYPASSAVQYSPPPTPTANPSSLGSSSTSTEPTAVAEPASPPHNGYRAVAYYGNWDIYARNFSPPEIPADRLTHLLYSFADNKDDGSIFLTDTYADTDKHNANDSWNDSGNNVYGNIKQLNILKASNRNLKVILSVGGWTYTQVNKHMDTPMATVAGRQKFAATCVDMIKNYGFDGIDVDWEYPQDTVQGSQFLALLKEIRGQMDDYAETLKFGNEAGEEMKPKFVLSIAAPAGKTNYRNLPLQQISQVTDFINLMAYDYAGSWDSNTGHMANLYPSTSNPLSTPFNTASVLADYIAAGVPPSKLNMGMPLYGRAFTNTAGLGLAYNSIGPGSFEAGVYDFNDLPLAGGVEMYDAEAGATYSYNQDNGMLVSYDTVDMALRKVDYVTKMGLGGAMWWEISGDKVGAGSIVSNVVKKMGGATGAGIESSPNWLLYPDSRYDNIKAGFSAQAQDQKFRRR